MVLFTDGLKPSKHAHDLEIVMWLVIPHISAGSCRWRIPFKREVRAGPASDTARRVHSDIKMAKLHSNQMLGKPSI